MTGGVPDRKNLVLVVVDTLRADHLGCYGNPIVRTPNIDALARDGARFTRVYPEAMPTMPMRRTIMTGRRAFPFRGWQPWEGLGKSPGWSPIMPGTRTVVDELRDAGYWTAYVTDNPFIGYAEALGPFRRSLDRVVRVPGHAAHTRPKSAISDRDARRVLPEYMHGWPHEVAKMRDFLAENGGAGGLDVDEAQTPAARVFGAAIETLREANPRRRLALRRKPLLMVVDGFDPHEPWAVPRRYRALYGDPDVPFIGNVTYRPTDRITEHELERLQLTYKACVSLVDGQIGRLLDEISALGLEDETTVMLVSDHGILLGERNWTGKSAWLLNPELIHVPLIVRDPDARRGVESHWFASTHDIPPTLMALAGLRPPARFEGSDLSSIVRGGAPPGRRDFAYGGYANDFFVRDDRWALISDNRRAGQKLFDLAADPGEHRDVSDRHPEVVDRLYGRMLAEIGRPPTFYRPERFELKPRTLDDV
ncbi:MAG: sulfatase [Thermoleophilaceae bacterium]